MSSAGGTMSGREMARATSMYATISAARETIQRRERRANRLSVDRAHDFLLVHDLPWISLIDDLLTIDCIEAARDPVSICATRLRLLCGPSRRLREQAADLQIFLHRQVGKEAAVLGRVADAEPRSPVRRHRADVLALEGDLAGAQRQQADDAVDGGGLAGAVASDQDH